jgi:hypothetical protein
VTVQFIQQYLVAVAGLVAGAGAGWVLAASTNGTRGGGGRLARWDARLTIPLLLAAAGAHLALIPIVELQRQVMFGLYVLALLGTVAVAMAGPAIWRLGAILLPAGSIFAYAYFATVAHQADVVGIAVKVVEVSAIGAALWPAIAARQNRQEPRRHASSG